jgi:hypothetical protein
MIESRLSKRHCRTLSSNCQTSVAMPTLKGATREGFDFRRA